MITKFKFTFREIRMVKKENGSTVQEASEILHSETVVCETVPAAELKAKDIAKKQKLYIRSIHHGPDNEVIVYTQPPPKEPPAPKAQPGKTLSPAKRKKQLGKKT